MTARDARQLLIHWANEQQHWVRGIVRDILATRQPASDSTIDGFYEACLVERDLRKGDIPSVPLLSVEDDRDEITEKLLIRAIRDVENVNRLAPDQEIEFNSRLTVLFGENATGKSGYVRILKRAAAVRSAEDILPDIRATEAPGPPRAILEYQMGSTEAVIDWTGEAGVRPITRTSVFDARAMAFHVDDDLTYVYTPRDLALFQYAHQAIKAVSERLARARNDARSGANPFLESFQQGSAVYSKIESLSAATDLAQLKALAVITEEEEGQLQSLRDTVEALKPMIVQSRLEVTQSDRDLYDDVFNTADSICKVDWANYNALTDKAREEEERYLESTQKAFKGTDIPAVLSETWREFIAAGEAYLSDLGRPDYPHADDNCIYCRQDLGEAALELVQKYREYSNNALKVALDEAREEVRTAGKDVSELRSEKVVEKTRQKIAATPTGAEPPNIVTAAAAFLEELPPIVGKVSAGQRVDGGVFFDRAAKLRDKAKVARQEADSLIGSLQKQGRERERELAERSTKLRDLEDRLVLKELLPLLRKHVEKARWAQRAETIIRERFPPLLRSLTTQSKVASEDLLNQDFERLFREECAALRAPVVRLEFPGRRGKPARRKSLAADHRLSEVLSEGEQKVIALSDFLAEAAIRAGSAPILFDDPVTSLDYKRLKYIVDRLYELSAEHQIIVFTHNIWFATALLARFEKIPDNCSYFSVDLGENNLTGIITGGRHPRWDTPGKLRPRINELIQNAGPISGEARQALVESAYSVLRSWCETVTEQDLLCGVTQRYQPKVMMTK